jgi:hypothetical protein
MSFMEHPPTPEAVAAEGERLKELAWLMVAAANTPSLISAPHDYVQHAYRFEEIAKWAAKVQRLVQKKQVAEARAFYAKARAGWLTTKPAYDKDKKDEPERHRVRAELARIAIENAQNPKTWR